MVVFTFWHLLSKYILFLYISFFLQIRISQTLAGIFFVTFKIEQLNVLCSTYSDCHLAIYKYLRFTGDVKHKYICYGNKLHPYIFHLRIIFSSDKSKLINSSYCKIHVIAQQKLLQVIKIYQCNRIGFSKYLPSNT